jgi:hypothetical protein
MVQRIVVSLKPLDSNLEVPECRSRLYQDPHTLIYQDPHTLIPFCSASLMIANAA